MPVPTFEELIAGSPSPAEPLDLNEVYNNAGETWDTAVDTGMPLPTAKRLVNDNAWQKKNDEQADSLLDRFEKQLYNSAAAGTLKALIRTGSMLVQAPLSIGYKIANLAGLDVEEKAPVYEAGQKFEALVPTEQVGQPDRITERITDTAAGVIGFITQLSALRANMPAGTSEPVIWETQNLITGGTPGMGAAMAVSLGAIGKMPASELAKTSAESALFYSLGRAGGLEGEDLYIQTALPIALRGISAGKRTLKEALGSSRQIQQAVKQAKIYKKQMAAQESENYPGMKVSLAKEVPVPTSETLRAEPRETIVQQEQTKGMGGLVEPVPPQEQVPLSQGLETPIAQPKVIGVDSGITAPPPTGIKAWTDRVIEHLKTAEKPREEIEEAKTEELGRRALISRQAAESATGEQRLHAALGALKGELTEYRRPDFKPVKEIMPKEGIDALYDDIWTRPWSEDHFDTLNTARAWEKVVDGYIPTRREILLLEKQWGPEIAKKLLKKRPWGDKAWDVATDMSNFIRTLVAGGDVSVAGRQLRVLGQLYPKEYAQSVKGGLKAYSSEKLAKEVRKEYQASPFHKEAKKYVQFFEPAGLVSVEPSERPEWYISNYPEKIPILGHLIRMGNRNYVETCNLLTQKIWDNLRADDIARDFKPTKADLAARGKWLMSMEGRPEIGGIIGRRIAPITAGFFFAPRFAISRFTTPTYMAKLFSGDPEAQAIGKKTAIAFASFVGTNVAILSLIKLGFGDKAEVELDPRSPDWGKGKIGDTRIDLWVGYQQAARFLVQTVTGQYKTPVGNVVDIPRTDVVGRFVRSKESPLVSLIADLWAGKTYTDDRPFEAPKGEMGKKLSELGIPDIVQGIGKEAYNRALFMWVQDFIDATINDGWPTGLAAGALSWYGISTSSYPATAYTNLQNYQDKIAQEAHQKQWDDLNSVEQKRLTREHAAEIDSLKLQVGIEGLHKTDYDYVSRLVADEKKAGENVYGKLSPDTRKALDEVGVSLGLSRKIGDWMLNDERYQRYQELTAQYLEEKLTPIVQSAEWSKLTLKRKKAKAELKVNTAKDKARSVLGRESRNKE